VFFTLRALKLIYILYTDFFHTPQKTDCVCIREINQ